MPQSSPVNRSASPQPTSRASLFYIAAMQTLFKVHYLAVWLCLRAQMLLYLKENPMAWYFSSPVIVYGYWKAHKTNVST